MFRIGKVINAFKIINFVLVVSMAGIPILRASDAPTDPKVDKLNAELAILKAQNAIADERRREAADAAKAASDSLPKSTITPLDGKTTADSNVVISSTVLAYASTSKIAKRIANEISAHGCVHSIMIHDDANVGSLSYYQAVLKVALTINKEYETTLEAQEPTRFAIPPGMALDTGISYAKSFLELISLFRTEVDLKGVQITLNADAIVAEVAHNLVQKEILVTYPKVFAPDLFYIEQEEPQKTPATTAPRRATLQLVLKTLFSLKERADKLILANDPKTDKLKAINAAFDQLIGFVMKVDDKTGIPNLATLHKAEAIYNLLDRDNAYVLQLTACAAGGVNKTTNNLFTGSRLYHQGGAVVSYILYDKNGKITDAHTLYEDGAFVKSGNISNEDGALPK